MAWSLWRQVQGQREASFSSAGEIKFEAISFIFDLREIDEDVRAKLFDWIMYIDHVARGIIERRDKTKSEAGKGKKTSTRKK